MLYATSEVIFPKIIITTTFSPGTAFPWLLQVIMEAIHKQDTSHRGHTLYQSLIFLLTSTVWKYVKNVWECCDRQLHFAVPSRNGQTKLVGGHTAQTANKKKLIIINQDLKVLKQMTGSLLASPNASLLDLSCLEVQWGFSFRENPLKKQGQVLH